MLWILVLRLLQSLVVRGYFSPDEYWQSLEVAHSMVWGYGYLTWEWRDWQLRSVVHPLFFGVFYWALKVLGLDYPLVVAYGPRVLMGFIMFASDCLVFKTAKVMFSESVAKKALVLSAGSWFLGYAGVRTYSNSFELLFTSLAVYYYVQAKDTQFNLSVGGACMLRPTSIMPWVPVYLHTLFSEPKRLLSTTCVG